MTTQSAYSPTQSAFIHLRMHTEYSISDGILQIPQALKGAEQDSMPALGISDLMNLFGMVKFYKAARGKGIKPIIGADIWVSPAGAPDQATRMLLICLNREGYGQLCELISRAFVENQHKGRASLLRDWLTQEACSGLIALSGAMQGDVGQHLLSGQDAAAAEVAQDWARRFPNRFYLEVQRAGHPGTETYIRGALDLAECLNLPVVATHPVQFYAAEDFMAHEARVCISQGNILADKRRPKDFTQEQYFKTQAQMCELFADMPEALANSVEIAKRASLSVVLGKNFLPQFPTPEGMSLDAFLVAEAQKGLVVRLKELYPNPQERESQRETYESRLRFECDTIIQMGFPGYFLIVADFINWAKLNGVPVGPGRGSGAGSLVAYSLRITDIDPLAYALLFERFLNPERVSMPDFDIDFCQDNRGRVIEYVRQRYGKEAVSQIATFGTMASKAVVRDVGRVLDLPYGLCDRLSKLIPVVQNKPLGLQEAREQEGQISEMMADPGDGESVSELWSLALPLEGLTRNVGMHAGGVLIAPGKVTDFCPVYQADGEESVTVSQFDKDDVEAIGLVKFDFLGLRNLTIIELALSYIEKLTGSRPDLMSLGFSDPAAYQVLKEANTTAIFQVESEGMKKLLAKLKPDRFEDIIAVLALYRPGPLGSGMVDDFILRKKGEQKIEYYHPDLKACLEPTYGVIVYQEQVMQISQIIGGYTLGGADMLRRAMGKKKPEEMAKHRQTIADGAKLKGYDPALAEHLFDLMTKFAEYGFNKSHTAAYAVLTYQTAWLKAYHCASFMAATLSSDMDNTDTVKIFYEDTLFNQIQVLAPDVNTSEYRFVPIDAKTIRYGLGAVKGVGQPAVEAIMKARNTGGAFQDLFDFAQRVDRRLVNRRVFEALIRAGAFDTLSGHAGLDRAVLMANVNRAIEAAEQASAHAGQGGLFDDVPEMSASIASFESAPAWDERQRLKEEKIALGFFFSGHPFNSYKKEVRSFLKRPLKDLEPGREPVMLAGIVMAIRTKMTARGKMALLLLDDGSAAHEVTLYAERFDADRGKINIDEVLVVEGKVSFDEFNNGLRIVAENLLTLTEARGRYARALEITACALEAPKDWAEQACTQLKEALTPFKNGACPVRLLYQNGQACATLQLDASWNVLPSEALINTLNALPFIQSTNVLYANH